MEARLHAVVDATPEAAKDWGDYVAKLYEIMLMRKAQGWFTGYNSNVEGHEKGTIRYVVFNGGTPKYRQKISEIADDGYRGRFAITRPRSPTCFLVRRTETVRHTEELARPRSGAGRERAVDADDEVGAERADGRRAAERSSRARTRVVPTGTRPRRSGRANETLPSPPKRVPRTANTPGAGRSPAAGRRSGPSRRGAKSPPNIMIWARKPSIGVS